MKSENTIKDIGMTTITVTVTNAGQNGAEASAPQEDIADGSIMWQTKQVSARVTPDEHALILAKGGLKSILRDVLRTSKHTEETINREKEKIEATESLAEGVVKLSKWHARQVDRLVNKACLFKSPDDLVMLAVSEFLIRNNLALARQ